MADGRVEFEITADHRPADQSIDEITRRLQQSGRQWERDAAEATDNIGNSFGDMAKKIAAGFSLAAVGKKLLDFGKQAVEAASDLAEVQNVVDTTFEDSSGTIDRWAKNAIKQFGLTETKAKQFASTMGAMLKSSGISTDSIVEMSTSLSGLAADMASFYNLDFDTAFQKIRSGISGETEPLKQLGINMSVANLEAFALQQGLGKTFSEMSQGEQIMLRYQYIMQATSDAQGDFAKTSDGFANGLRLLESNFEALKTNLGGLLIDYINPLIEGINSLFSGGKRERTVLDDFADINAETERKLAQIQTTVDNANSLVDLLGQIERDSTGAMASLNSAVGSIKDIPQSTVDNAGKLADSLSKMEKAKVGQNINLPDISAKAASYDGVAVNLESISGSVKKLEESELKEDSNVVKGIAKMADSGDGVKQLGDGLVAVKGAVDDLDGNKLAEKTGELEAALKPVSSETQEVAGASETWLNLCERLVKTIPGLSSIINTQTGEIEGGTEAVREYIEQWGDVQKKMVRIDAAQQYQSALAEKKSQLDDYYIEAGTSYNLMLTKRDRFFEELKKSGAYDQYMSNTRNAYRSEMELLQATTGIKQKSWEELSEFEQMQYIARAHTGVGLYGNAEEEEAFYASVRAAKEKDQIYKDQVAAYDEASVGSAEYTKQLERELSVEDKALILHEKQQEALQGLKDKFNAANEAMKNYREKAIDQTLDSVNKLLHGFEKIEMKAEDMTSAEDMLEGLMSQADYMKAYAENLKIAKENGLDEKLLAELSDGSKESAAYLAAIAAEPERIKEINDAYNEVNKQKEEFAETLAKNQLAVDDEYKNLTETVNQAQKDLDEAQKIIIENTGNNTKAIAQQIEDNIPVVQAAVDKLNGVLNRAGMSTIYIPGISNTNGEQVQGYATGLDYVPYDNFLARLHAGESILTAEEARVWRGMKQGGVDYDQLAGVMRDNIQPGGNVYLDGRAVGAVISQMQGNQYRSLQRSGWQS